MFCCEIRKKAIRRKKNYYYGLGRKCTKCQFSVRFVCVSFLQNDVEWMRKEEFSIVPRNFSSFRSYSGKKTFPGRMGEWLREPQYAEIALNLLLLLIFRPHRHASNVRLKKHSNCFRCQNSLPLHPCFLFCQQCRQICRLHEKSSSLIANWSDKCYRQGLRQFSHACILFNLNFEINSFKNDLLDIKRIFNYTSK